MGVGDINGSFAAKIIPGYLSIVGSNLYAKSSSTNSLARQNNAKRCPTSP
jgi:hypothetical protein